jgi:hypothetical protein
MSLSNKHRGTTIHRHSACFIAARELEFVSRTLKMFLEISCETCWRPSRHAHRRSGVARR